MAQILGALLAALEMALALLSPQMTVQRLRSGEWLRFHVVAQDDSAEMQRVKICVRDAVQQCYRDNRLHTNAPMLAQAEALLPMLSQAAEESTRREGYGGDVSVSLETCAFGERQLNAATIPAGEYPALMIRLGQAHGRNWWGLLDPDLSLWLACIPDDTGGTEIVWDWSWAGLWAALFGLPLLAEGA
ncbi:MAG: hypothetical protein E7327_08095 [Clostridiales bacterium]|nr:hypothetical protein [Clostridiales bacterium]